MATFRTVSEESAWTDWSERNAPASTNENHQSKLGVIVAFAVALALLAGTIFLLPPGSY